MVVSYRRCLMAVAAICVLPSVARAQTNPVHIELTHGNWYFTKADAAENVPVVWRHQWFTNLIPNGSTGVMNPVVQLKSAFPLLEFSPNNPSVFTADTASNTYTWNFRGLTVPPGSHLALNAFDAQPTLTEQPRFSASRAVEPRKLTEPVTDQVVTATVKIEEAPPPGATQLSVTIGSPVMVWGGNQLVTGQFVGQTPVPGWWSTHSAVSASWTISPANLVVGSTYTFQAVLRATKSPDLLGNPLFVPGVMVSWSRWQNFPPVTAASATITSPAGGPAISATFSADNPVQWRPGYSDTRYDFWFSSVVSQTTPPPAPFHVLEPATVRLEPEVINLKSKGVITAFVELPAPYTVADVNLAKVFCQQALAINATIAGDKLIFKFDRQQLKDLPEGDTVHLWVAGELADGSYFFGQDSVRLIR